MVGATSSVHKRAWYISALSILSKLALMILVVAYPIGVYWGMMHFEIRALALALLLAFSVSTTLRYFSRQPLLNRTPSGQLYSKPIGGLGKLVGVAVLPITLLSVAALLKSYGWVLLVPSAMNFALFLVFAQTLWGGEPLIERFAKLIHSNLSKAEVQWCRLWTWIWSSFLFFNAIMATVLAVWAPLGWWALYTGLIAYLGMGCLFAVEWTLRKIRFRRLGSNAFEQWLFRKSGEE